VQHNVLKYGIGYDLITDEQHRRMVLGIRCHTCDRVSFHPKDIRERYCGHCHVFHEAYATRRAEEPPSTERSK
jgi:hypothetical protein